MNFNIQVFFPSIWTGDMVVHKDKLNITTVQAISENTPFISHRYLQVSLSLSLEFFLFHEIFDRYLQVLKFKKEKKHSFQKCVLTLDFFTLSSFETYNYFIQKY